MNDFLAKAYELKHLDRAGWLRVGISSPESVASHSWGVSLLCLRFCPQDLCKEKVLSMALLHDVPEVIVGDITPHDGISKEEKSTREMNAAKQLLPEELFLLWKECHDKETPEAKFINLMDKLDMAIQAKLYSNKTDTTEFIESADRILNQEQVPIEIQQYLKEIHF
jgi:putative hydrolases of HD superfamily